jgi:glycosyltransferase involved in cell wall biosynthesis
VSVVIPCFRVRNHIIDLLAQIGPEVTSIFVIDDACPERSGELVAMSCRDPRVRVVRHAVNRGVGGAVMTGYRHALAAGADIIARLDGDGQMDPALISRFIAPIAEGRADYVKGNRFFNIEDLKAMPAVRIFGNAALSFLAKMSSGYWRVFDPNNGYTAINATLASNLPMGKISQRYFFESDLLFRLGTLRAVVSEVPMSAVYNDEVSGVVISRAFWTFLRGHVRNYSKRIFYEYFLRGFSIASMELLVGLGLLAFGVIFGAVHWVDSVQTGTPATAGTVVLSALPTTLGVQLLLSFLAYDSGADNRSPISRSMVRQSLHLDADDIQNVTRCVAES